MTDRMMHLVAKAVRSAPGANAKAKRSVKRSAAAAALAGSVIASSALAG